MWTNYDMINFGDKSLQVELIQRWESGNGSGKVRCKPGTWFTNVLPTQFTFIVLL